MGTMYYLVQDDNGVIGTATNLDFCAWSETRGAMQLCPATSAQVIACAGGYYRDSWMAEDVMGLAQSATVTPIHQDVYDFYNDSGTITEPEPEPEETPTVLYTEDLEVTRATTKAKLLAERNTKLQAPLEFSFGKIPQTAEGLAALTLAYMRSYRSTTAPCVLTEAGYVEITATDLADAIYQVDTYRQSVEAEYQSLLAKADVLGVDELIKLHMS